MLDMKLRVPHNIEECNKIRNCKECYYYSQIISYNCEKRNLIKMNKTESKGMVDFPLVTTGSVKITPIVYPYHLTFVPRLFRDGNMWCALYGENIMEGIVGFGKTPDEAIYSFNNAFYEEMK